MLKGMLKESEKSGFAELLRDMTIAELVGRATTCWEDISRAGLFDSRAAGCIADEIRRRIVQLEADLAAERKISAEAWRQLNGRVDADQAEQAEFIIKATPSWKR